jgi:hypothetical protein
MMNIHNIPVKVRRRARIRAWLRRWWLRFLLVDQKWQDDERWDMDEGE